MTIVYGKIESLKKVRETLHQAGIDQFKSIADINEFARTYNSELLSAKKQIEDQFEEELEQLNAQVFLMQSRYDQVEIEATTQLESRLEKIDVKTNQIRLNPTSNIVVIAFNMLFLTILDIYKAILQKLSKTIIRRQTKPAAKDLAVTTERFYNYKINRSKVIEEQSSFKVNQLTHTMKVIEEINPLIAGAIGENKIQKELAKLSDSHILFNDFSLKFSRPIYNKKEKDKIFSIQIDHLLVTPAGIFIVETKNWSRSSLERLDLRSPIKQIRRTSYALFVMLNSSKNQKLELDKHHWGDKEIPIRNVVAMINHKPKEKFKYVHVVTLDEIIGYIGYFDPIFSDLEVSAISNHLMSIQDDNPSSVHKRDLYDDLILSMSDDNNPSSKPSLSEWLAKNPGKGINEYYSHLKK